MVNAIMEIDLGKERYRYEKKYRSAWTDPENIVILQKHTNTMLESKKNIDQVRKYNVQGQIPKDKLLKQKV